MGVAFCFPGLYLPSYAESIGLGATNGALLLTLMSVSQVAGQFPFGSLSNKKISPNTLLATSLSIAATATLSLWGLGRSFPPLVFFVLLYGFFGAGCKALWARMVTAVSDEPSASRAIFSLFCFEKGVGIYWRARLERVCWGDSMMAGEYGHGITRLLYFSMELLCFSVLGVWAQYILGRSAERKCRTGACE
jgi:uncharacterized protein YjeT (DUF2065 family)